MEKKVFDEATRQALLGLAPFSLNSTIDFTPASYQLKRNEQLIVPEDLWPVFTIRPWTKLESDLVKRALSQVSNNVGTKAENEAKEAVRKVIKSWSNLIDAGSMEEIEYVEETDGGASKDIFNNFPASLVSDLLNKCCSISGILDMERSGLKS